MDHNHHNHEHADSEAFQSGDSLMYTCPMHPEILQDKPGMCPECGMSLVPTKTKKKDPHSEEKESDKHAGHKTESFL